MNLAGVRWRKSSFSDSNSSQGGGCVEIAFLGDAVGLRDSKDRGRPAHRYPVAAWAGFLAGIRAGEFELG